MRIVDEPGARERTRAERARSRVVRVVRQPKYS